MVGHHRRRHPGPPSSGRLRRRHGRPGPAQRRRTEQTLAGLRFVRNRIGDEADLAEFIEPADSGPDSSDGHITGWTWKQASEPKLISPVLRGQAWEMNRYQAYQAQLAGRAIEETFARTTAFLKLAVADAPALTDASVHAPR